MSEADSFQVRVKNAVKGNYHSSMRRSLQSVALYEADRCLKSRYPNLRPFQKKFALHATTIDLINSLDFLNDYHRQEIMFRTNASKEQMPPDLAWKRMKLITREMNQTILPKAKALIEQDDNSEKTHDEICDMLLQSMYEESKSSNAHKVYGPMWEYNHNNIFTVYRIFFRGVTLDADIYPAVPPRIVEVPETKPGKGNPTAREIESLRAARKAAGGRGDSMDGTTLIPLANMSIKPAPEPSVQERWALLKEVSATVKDHMELLKEFDGVISRDELIKRKRSLFAALPPVPPPGGTKKQKVVAKGGAAGLAPMEEEDWEKVDETKDASV